MTIRQQAGWLQLGDLTVSFVFPVFVEETDESPSPPETTVT
jgi:hypothetical protein